MKNKDGIEKVDLTITNDYKLPVTEKNIIKYFALKNKKSLHKLFNEYDSDDSRKIKKRDNDILKTDKLMALYENDKLYFKKIVFEASYLFDEDIQSLPKKIQTLGLKNYNGSLKNIGDDIESF